MFVCLFQRNVLEASQILAEIDLIDSDSAKEHFLAVNEVVNSIRNEFDILRTFLTRC